MSLQKVPNLKNQPFSENMIYKHFEKTLHKYK